MLLLVALVMVCTYTVVAAEEAENTSHKPPLHYSSLALPQHHIPYFLHNNKRVARLCREDPLCPFKVRTALSLFLIVQGELLFYYHCVIINTVIITVLLSLCYHDCVIMTVLLSLCYYDCFIMTVIITVL